MSAQSAIDRKWKVTFNHLENRLREGFYVSIAILKSGGVFKSAITQIKVVHVYLFMSWLIKREIKKELSLHLVDV